MRHVWNWAVCAPALLLAAACIAAGWREVLEPPLAWTGAAFFAVIAEVASRLARRARRRAEKKQAAIEALAATALLREQLRSVHHRRAA
jgi:membrane protein implicated in regulation of membrane protease activity